MDNIMNATPYGGFERRKYFRYNLIFAPRQKARLTTATCEFDVIDFSDGGLRFSKAPDTILERYIQGNLVRADGQSTPVEGRIVWHSGDEAGLEYAPIADET